MTKEELMRLMAQTSTPNSTQRGLSEVIQQNGPRTETPTGANLLSENARAASGYPLNYEGMRSAVQTQQGFAADQQILQMLSGRLSPGLLQAIAAELQAAGAAQDQETQRESNRFQRQLPNGMLSNGVNGR